MLNLLCIWLLTSMYPKLVMHLAVECALGWNYLVSLECYVMLNYWAVNLLCTWLLNVHFRMLCNVHQNVIHITYAELDY